MIQQERLKINGRIFIRTYSDKGYYIIGGSPEDSYSEAIDPIEFNRQYTEGNYMTDDELLARVQEILDIILGG